MTLKEQIERLRDRFAKRRAYEGSAYNRGCYDACDEVLALLDSQPQPSPSTVTITVERELLSRYLQGEDNEAHTDFWNALVEQSGAMDDYCKRAEAEDE